MAAIYQLNMPSRSSHRCLNVSSDLALNVNVVGEATEHSYLARLNFYVNYCQLGLSGKSSTVNYVCG